MIETVEIKTCDIAHEKPRKGAETVSFGLDNTEYQIELCPKDRAALEKVMSMYVPYARRARVNGAAGKKNAYRPISERRKSAAIRAWAESQGITVSARGRIPAEVLEQYRAAH
jgi:nucleoid-associated protein Lsr2